MLINSHPKYLSFEENLSWLLELQPELDNRLFGQDKQLLPEVQNKLLKSANVFIKDCIQIFPGFTVKDIVLCGSACSYYYHPFSDIDIKVIVTHERETSIFAGDTQAYKFLCRYVDAYYKKHRPLKLNNKILDIRVALYCHQRELYSILHRKWITKASRKVMKRVNPQEVLSKVEEILEQIRYIKEEKFEKINGKYKISDINQMEKFYNHLLYIKTTSATNMLVNKLLNYSGDLHRFRQFCREELIKSLSF